MSQLKRSDTGDPLNVCNDLLTQGCGASVQIPGHLRPIPKYLWKNES